MAFSLGVELFPFSWFDIAARQTKGLTPLPVLCAVPAANDYAYVGLIKDSTVDIMRFGPLRTELARISEGLTKVAVAGRIRNQISSLVEAEVIDTGIETPDAHTLLELGYQALESVGNSTTQVQALNDQSEIFYERTSVHD
jgi:tRNA A37 threonylcarbamoyladenosine modification protein TsaB